jgi:UDP-glucose 4-epimerase
MRWAYSTAKVVDEILANAYHREFGLQATVVRFFNTVGPRQSPAYGMVIPRLVRQALAGEPLTVYGDGTQTRCFAHVADVVDALLRLLDDKASIGETFNIGSPHEISILDLARRIVEYTESDSEIRLVPYEAAYGPGFEDMSRRVPDTRKLTALTGWKPTRTLDETILDTIAAAARPAVARMGVASS